MKDFITKRWGGPGYVNGNRFYIKPKFKGLFFQVQAHGVFIEKASLTEVSVVFNVDRIVKWLLLLSSLGGPIFFMWLKLTDSFFLGSSPTKNVDFLLLVHPIFMMFVSYMIFYSQCDLLKRVIKSVITKRKF